MGRDTNIPHLFPQSWSQLIFHSACICSGIALTHVQDLVEPHKVCSGPPLKPLDGIPSLQCWPCHRAWCQWQSASLKSRCELPVCSLCCPEDFKLHYLMVTAAKAALGLHIPHHTLLVGGHKVQHSTSPHSEKEVTSAFQEASGLPLPYVLALQQIIGVVKVPHEAQDLWTWGCSYLWLNRIFGVMNTCHTLECCVAKRKQLPLK